MPQIRISFPGGERSDHVSGEGIVRVGSDPGVDLVLPAAKGVSASHVELSNEQRRGLALRVLDREALVHVNGRRVREQAILRLGDVIVAGQVRMVLRPEVDRTERPPPASNSSAEARNRAAPPRVVLRGLAGPWFGKLIQVRGQLVVGRGRECDLVLDEPGMAARQIVIENTPTGLYLRDLGSPNGTWVNGTAMREAILRPGDQLAFEQSRFLIEAPGYFLQAQPEAAVHTIVTSVQRPLVAPPPAATPSPASSPSVSARAGNVVDWIIMAAAVVTLLALAILVYLEFGG
jgi:pSer/pThr/pTyr-binding forkhead associated (FHA) protein